MKILNHDFQFTSVGQLEFDPGKGTKVFEPNWCIMKCDQGIADYYSWFLKKEGIEVFEPNKLWGFHISVIKGEAPQRNLDKWLQFNQASITFQYGNFVSYSNGRHAWLTCYSDQLSDIRDYFGLETNGYKLKYHMTLGRLKNPTQPDVKRPGTIYDDGDGLAAI